MGTAGADPAVATAQNYRRFARQEAAGRSSAYERLALAVAADRLILGFLAGLPQGKRQPNLLFAAARLLLATSPTIEGLRDLVAHRPSELAATMNARRTQTNEPARCAALLPVLARIPGPLALIEVGASAGLCLQLDRYSYDYGMARLTGSDPEAPVLRCELRGDTPQPARMPDVTWRAGLDLDPLDPADPDDQEWLRCLVWPGQAERLHRLDAAIATAQRFPIPVHRGDLVDDLAALVARAPGDATVVVYHSAVLAYVDSSRCRQFAEVVQSLGVHWLSNEAVGVLPDVSHPTRSDALFLLCVDGVPIAFTHPHGEWIDWINR